MFEHGKIYAWLSSTKEPENYILTYRYDNSSKDNLSEKIIDAQRCNNTQNGQRIERTSHGIDDSWIRQHIDSHRK